MSKFIGSGVAITTPFNENNEIDFEVLERHIEFLIVGKTDAIIVAGTTGEGATLSEREHKELVKRVVKIVNKRVPIIVGTGSNNTKKAYELTKQCSDYGVDGFLVVTPYYNKGTQKGLIEHFTYIASSTNLPIILYNVPSRTNVNMEANTVYELSKVKNIVGIKEASGNLSQVAKIASMCGKEFYIYSGNDDQITSVMALGGKGVISVLGNICPEVTHDIVHKFIEGKVEDSIELQLKYIEMIESLFTEVNPIPVKMALKLMGIGEGNLRLPLTEIEEEGFKKLKKEMENKEII